MAWHCVAALLLAVVSMVTVPVRVTHGATDPVGPSEDQVTAGDTGQGHGANPKTSDSPQETVPGLDLELYWQQGVNYRVAQQLRLLGMEASLSGRIGLRLNVDGATYDSEDGLAPIDSQVQVRRLFFYTTGEWNLIRPVYFAIDIGLVDDGFFIDDAYLWLTDLPYVGTFKIGQFKAPMSLATLTSSSTRPFMEIGSPAEAFSPGSKAGFQLANDALEKRLTWAIGYFADTQEEPVGDATQSIARVVARLTWLPLYRNVRRLELLHLGLSGSYVFSNLEEVHYDSRPESYLAPKLVSTGTLDASNAAPFGFELAYVRGPFSMQSEFLGSSVNEADLGDPLFYGLYAYASYFLTGETRPYKRASAVFGPVVPARSITWDDWKLGAWEIGARASTIDLTDGVVKGGEMWILMGSVNWYLNRYVRLMFEYGHANVGAGPSTGAVNIFQARFQLVI